MGEHNHYTYLLDKLSSAPILTQPFPHLEINDFLNPSDLERILRDEQIHFKPVEHRAFREGTEVLMNRLESTGWKLQPFPGCTMDTTEYLRCLDSGFPAGQTTEGVGIAYRLHSYNNPQIRKLVEFMNSPEFERAMLDKFNITNRNVRITTAIQKYLSHYEISPHPDIREKCMTYLLNINKPGAETEDIHTHLLEFQPERAHISRWWDAHPDRQRIWVPWSYCRTVKRITDNNTMLMFAPSNTSLHAIKLDYDHCRLQRTQIYGNLFYNNNTSYPTTDLTDLDT